MHENLNDEILREAVAISDNLLSSAIQDSTGMYWKTLGLTGENTFDYKISETIYAGNAGILLFFTELYRHTTDARHLACFTCIAFSKSHGCCKN